MVTGGVLSWDCPGVHLIVKALIRRVQVSPSAGGQLVTEEAGVVSDVTVALGINA